MATTKSATQVTTGKVRLSYVQLFEPKAPQGSDKLKYSVSVIIDKEDKETIAKVEAAVKAAFEASIGKLGLKPGAKMPPAFSPLHDGDEQRPDDPAYVGKYYINAKSDRKPLVVDRSKLPITDPLAIVSGDYGRVSINFYGYNAAGNKGIGAGLSAVQFVQRGEPLGSVINADVAFGDDFEMPEDDDDL